MLSLWNEIVAEDFDAKDAVAVLCVGSCEQHGLHLPLGTDAMLAEAVAKDAARLANAKMVLLPVQKIGYSPHHRGFNGCVTLSQDAMFHYILEICLCIYANGFRKLMIVNGHGGNQSCLQTVVNELGARGYRQALLVRYWDLIADQINDLRTSQSGGMGHAGEFETSMMLHYYPELVKVERIKDYPPAQGNRYHGPDLFAKNCIYQYKCFDEYSKDGNVGQPKLASAEKGAEFAHLAAQALADLADDFLANTF